VAGAVSAALSRRRLLAFGAGGAALLGCGGALSWLTVGYSLPPGDVAVGLSVKELAIVRAIVEALLPEDGDLPSGLSLGVHQRVDEEVWSAPDDVRSDLRAAIQLLEVLPPLYGFPGRLTRLRPDQRLACLQALRTAGWTPIVQAVTALQQMCHLFAYVQPGSWPAIGYDGPWVGVERPPPSSVRYAEVLAAARRSP
jgi:hypothetical protein